MCEPTTIVAVAGLAISAASTVASTMGQAESAAAEESYQNALSIQRNQQIEVNQILANRSAADQQAQINQQTSEQQIAASQDIQESQTAALEARAAQRVASGESGVSGISVDSLINDTSRKEARYADSVAANLEGYEQNAESQKLSVESQRQGRVASIAPYIKQPVQQPDYLGAALKIGGAGLSTYSKITEE